jgi:uncharacterized protein YkwD
MSGNGALAWVMALAAVLGGMSGCVSNQTRGIENRALDLVNRERVSAGLEPLVMDDAVRGVARAHSADMAARHFASHDNPDGVNPFQRLDAAGIPYAWAGENIAWNDFSTPAEAALTAWMGSAEHSGNILRAQFTRTGMGVAADGAGGYYFTQVFIGGDQPGR